MHAGAGDKSSNLKIDQEIRSTLAVMNKLSLAAERGVSHNTAALVNYRLMVKACWFHACTCTWNITVCIIQRGREGLMST